MRKNTKALSSDKGFLLLLMSEFCGCTPVFSTCTGASERKIYFQISKFYQTISSYGLVRRILNGGQAMVSSSVQLWGQSAKEPRKSLLGVKSVGSKASTISSISSSHGQANMSLCKDTLVKYDNPVLANQTNPVLTAESKGDSEHKSNEHGRGHSKQEELLHSMFLPREWRKGDELWVQHISSTPATRLDVIKLREVLDHALEERKANEFGICSIREELYAECFNEIIRQVTISCTERGELLLRLRDEVHMTVDAYRNLYESSVAFGIRKALVARHEKEEMESTIEKLTEEGDDLKQQAEDLTSTISTIQQREASRRELEKAMFQEEIVGLKKRNEQIKDVLERFMVKSQGDEAVTSSEEQKYEPEKQ